MKDCFTCAYLNGAGFCSRSACTYLSENDLVPVIRCKDCIHRYSTCPMITIHPTGSITFRAQDDWFCFMGERKEE